MISFLTSKWRPERWAPWLLRHGVMVAIAAIFVVLGSRYVLSTPTFETPDEPWHYQYIRRLAHGEGLPPLALATDEWEQGEAHQPPLYYAIGALLTLGVENEAPEDLYIRNPYAALGKPHAVGNKNAVLHLEQMSPPPDVVRAVRRLRWFSLSCSLFTVLLTYGIALQVAPRRRVLALGSAALVAFNPQFLFISASASNDSLITALSTLVLWLSCRTANRQIDPPRDAIWLGIIVGLASLAKLSGLALSPVACLALALKARSTPFDRQGWRNLASNLWRPLAIMLA